MTDAPPSVGARDDLPDWRSVSDVEAFRTLPAYRTSGTFFAVPTAIVLASTPTLRPDFFLEFLSDRNAAGPEQALYAQLHMGLAVAGDLARATRVLAADCPGATLLAAALSPAATCRFELDDECIGLPIAWQTASRATLDARLSERIGTLLYAQLAGGRAVAARVGVECTVSAMLPRVEAGVSVDPAALRVALAQLAAGTAPLPFSALIAWLKSVPPVLRVDTAISDPAAAALAIAGRLLGTYGVDAACPRLADGPFVALTVPDGPTLRWDLRTPTAAALPLLLPLDPFTSIVAASARSAVTAFTRVGPLPDDMLSLRVAVASGFPAVIANCQSIEATLCVDPLWSRSKAVAAETVTLYPPPADRGSQPVVLRFGKTGAKPYRTRLCAVIDDQPVELPWRDGSGDYLYFGANDLPYMLAAIRAAPALLDLARIDVAIDGTDLSATLTSAAPAVAFLLPPDVLPRLRITAHDPAGQAAPRLLDLAGPVVDIELTSFPDYGAQAVDVNVAFASPAAAAVRYAFQAADHDGPIVLEFSPTEPHATFSYFADRLFDAGYRYRLIPPDGAETEWSAPCRPGPLSLTAPQVGRAHDV